MNIKVFYRIHFGKDNKNRPGFYSKEVCFKSFLQSYLDSNLKEYTEFGVFIDNFEKDVSKEPLFNNIIQPLQKEGLLKVEFLEEIGNSESYLYCLEESIENNDDTTIFFVEDDYIWKNEAFSTLVQSFPLLKCDYLTPYDHPVRYDPAFVGGSDIPHWYNYIHVSNGYHFRSQESTCMTFLSSAKILKEDRFLHKHFTKGRNCPHDRDIFRTLQCLENKDNLEIIKERLLLGPMPSIATHCNKSYLAPNVDWYNLTKQMNLNERYDRSNRK
jgi:hypothetical protein